MKILKHETHSLFPHPVMLGGMQWLSAGVMIYFDLMNPDALLSEQELWGEAPEQLGENPVLDQGWPKPRGEFLVAGAACAPGKERVHALKVSVRVDKHSKELLAIGDRFWVQSGLLGRKISSPIPYSEMPVTWTRAFGGEGYALNPAGKGAAEIKTDDGLSIQPLPNIEHAGQLIISPSDRPEPAGFGLVPPHYPQRSRLMGTCDKRWLKARWPGFPEDLDPDFFLAAPAGQQLPEYFTGEEKIEICNMHHEVPRIISRLPRRRIRLFFMRRPEGKTKGYLPQEIAGGEYSEAKLSADTLWLFPNILRGVLIHRALVPCRDDEFSDIAWTHIVDEDPDAEPLPVEHYRDMLLEKADFGQGAMAGKMLELQREMGKGALTVRNLPKRLREMQAPSDEAPTETTPFHARWFPFFGEARDRLQEGGETMLLLNSLGIETDCIVGSRLGWNDQPRMLGADDAHSAPLRLPRGLVIPRFSGAVLTGLTIRPEPLSDASLAVELPGSSGIPIMLEAAIPGGPLVVVADELSALLVESEAGDFADIAVAPRPESPLPDAAQKRIAAGAPVVLMLAEAPAPDCLEAWERALPGVKIASFGAATTLFEAREQGADLREAILRHLPEEMARQHRLVVTSIAGKDAPGTPIEAVLSAEAVKAAIEQGLKNAPDSVVPDTSENTPTAVAPEPPEEMRAAFAKQEMERTGVADGPKEQLRQRLASGESFAMASFSNLDLNGIDFSGIDLSMASFENCSMRQCRFERARLESVSFSTCDLASTDLTGAALERTIFSECNLAGMRCIATPLFMVSFTDSDLTNADFSESTLNMVNFRNDIMKQIRLDRSRVELCTIAESDLSESRFDGTLFLKSMMEKCVFDRAVFASIATDSLLLHGCAAKEARWERSKLFKLRIGEGCRFPGVVFAGCEIDRGYFRGANFQKALFPLSSFKSCIMDDCDLSQADFDMSPMSGCELLKCNLANANLSGCNLFAGSLRKSNLAGSDLGGANLYAVDFRKCVMGGTNMNNANLKRSLLADMEDELKKGGHIL